jgi:hypothetical protein
VSTRLSVSHTRFLLSSFLFPSHLSSRCLPGLCCFHSWFGFGIHLICSVTRLCYIWFRDAAVRIRCTKKLLALLLFLRFSLSLGFCMSSEFNEVKVDGTSSSHTTTSTSIPTASPLPPNTMEFNLDLHRTIDQQQQKIDQQQQQIHNLQRMVEALAMSDSGVDPTRPLSSVAAHPSTPLPPTSFPPPLDPMSPFSSEMAGVPVNRGPRPSGPPVNRQLFTGQLPFAGDVGTGPSSTLPTREWGVAGRVPIVSGNSDSELDAQFLKVLRIPTAFTGEDDKQRKSVRSWIMAMNEFLSNFSALKHQPAKQLALVVNRLEGSALMWLHGVKHQYHINQLNKPASERLALGWDVVQQWMLSQYEGPYAYLQWTAQLDSLTYGVGACKDLTSYIAEFQNIRRLAMPTADFDPTVNRMAGSKFGEGIRRGSFPLYVAILNQGMPVSLDQWKTQAEVAMGILRNIHGENYTGVTVVKGQSQASVNNLDVRESEVEVNAVSKGGKKGGEKKGKFFSDKEFKWLTESDARRCFACHRLNCNTKKPDCPKKGRFTHCTEEEMKEAKN